MTEDQIAKELSIAYSTAPNRDKALHMMLFAIENADALRDHNAHRLCELAGIPKWGPQLNLGRKLSAYVEISK